MGGPRQRTVLAALVMRAGHTVSPTVLADAVWPDGPPPAATGTMQAYISRLRALLGAERLLRTEGGYRLALERDELDEWLLTDALREAEHYAEDSHRHLVDALSLWRGPPLGDLSTELFAAPYVAAMDDLHVRAVSRAARHLLDRDDPQEAASVLTRAIAEHPYEQSLVADYMAAQARLARPDAALRAYRALAGRLKRDLGIAPDEGVRNLARTVAATSPAARAAVIAQERRDRSPHVSLPDPPGTLVGRRDELDMLRARMAEQRVVTVVGPPGVGKSRLALEASWSAASSYAGATRVLLEGVRDGSSLLRMLASSCAVSEQPGEPLASTLARALRSRGRFLLVIDSAEHLEPAAVDALACLLEACVDLRLVMTSLQPLALPQESLLRLGPLPVPRRDGRLLESDAGRLLVERARTAQPGFAVHPDNESVLVDITRRLDGLPLAMELAAGQLAVLGPAELSRRLSDRFAILLAPGSSGRHTSMHAALSTAVDELTDDERAVLTRLGVAAGPLPMTVAEQLCTGLGSPRSPSARATLMTLARRSLVINDAQGVTMLESVRAFCATRLRRRGEWDAAVAHHGDVLHALLVDMGQHAHTPRQGWAAAQVAALYREIRSALAQLPVEPARRLAALVSPWWYRAGRLSDLADLGTRFPCEGTCDASCVPICGYSALALATDGRDWDRARRLAARAVAAAESTGDEARILEARLLRGDVATLVGDWDRAASDLDLVVERAVEPWMVALARLRRMRVDWATNPSVGGLASQRRHLTQRAVAASGDPSLAGYLQLTQGNRLMHMGRLLPACEALSTGVRALDEVSHWQHHRLGLLLVAQLDTLRGRWDEARRQARSLLEHGLGTATPFPWDPREVLARCHLESGNAPAALELLADLEAEARNRRDATLIAVCTVDRAQAVEVPEQAAAVLADAPPSDALPAWQQADVLIALADAALGSGRPDEAASALDQARAGLAELGEPALVHEARLALAQSQLAVAEGATATAVEALTRVQRLCQQSGYMLSRSERRRHSHALEHCRAALDA